MRGRALTFSLLMTIASGTVRAEGVPAWRALEADSLYRHAIALLQSDDGREARLQAMRTLDQATRLDPSRPEPFRELARLCIAAGQFQRSRACLTRIEALMPDDVDARIELGRSWRWDWLTSQDTASQASAARCFLAAAKRAPRSIEPRVSVVAIALAAGDTGLAARAAESAIRIAPDSADALLALGCVAYRRGDLARAESAFRAAIPRLAPALGARLETSASFVKSSARDTSARFWRGHDPDLTTPENEVELDFLSRVAQALLLFRDERGRPRWDVRTELFVRYGLPSRIEVNPAGAKLEYAYRRLAPVEYAPDPLEYPFAMQVWNYPELGIRAELWDQSLQQSYELPISSDRDPESRAHVTASPEIEVVGDGRAVYRTMPQGLQRLPARGAIARFPSVLGARLVAHVEVPGDAADSLHGTWIVVSEDDGHVITRGSTRLAVSTCAPGERRVASFSAEVPPGRYQIDVSVDGAGRRGVVRSSARVAAPAAGLAISDLVMLCDRAPAASTQAVWIEPDLDHRANASRPLALYFEIDGLVPDTGGTSRFAYRYAVRPLADDGRRKRQEPLIEATREEENVGPLRRQYLSIPIAGLKRGRHEIEVEIRDLVSGTVVNATTTFTRE
jgi:Tfp pilus assembly protein PilF